MILGLGKKSWRSGDLWAVMERMSLIPRMGPIAASVQSAFMSAPEYPSVVVDTCSTAPQISSTQFFFPGGGVKQLVQHQACKKKSPVSQIPRTQR